MRSRLPTAEDDANYNPHNGGTALTDSTSILMAEHRTDRANGKRFIQIHGDDVRYVATWNKWLVWDGRRWVIDDFCRIEALAKFVADAIWDEVKEELIQADQPTQSALISFARASASARG